MNKSFLLAFVSLATYAAEPKSPQTPVLKPLNEAHSLLKYDLCNPRILKNLHNTKQQETLYCQGLIESYECKLCSKKTLIGNRNQNGIACYIISISRDKNELSTKATPAHPDIFFKMRENYNKNNLGK